MSVVVLIDQVIQARRVLDNDETIFLAWVGKYRIGDRQNRRLLPLRKAVSSQAERVAFHPFCQTIN